MIWIIAVLAVFIGVWVGIHFWLARMEQSKLISIGGGFVAAVLMLAIVGTLFFPEKQDVAVSVAPRKPTTLEAWGMCQQFLAKRLKAPKTAEYPSPYDRFIKQVDDNTFHAEAYVDAQNVLGVPLRANFICTVRYAGNDMWDLVYLNLLEP